MYTFLIEFKTKKYVYETPKKRPKEKKKRNPTRKNMLNVPFNTQVLYARENVFGLLGGMSF